MTSLIRRQGNGGEGPAVSDLIDQFFSRHGSPMQWRYEFVPAVDIIERDSEFLLVAECPGLAPESLDITVEGNTLTVSGEKKNQWPADADVYTAERRYGTFSRCFTLPSVVDPQKITARFHDGLLEIGFPKVPEAQPHRIEITSK